MQLEPGTADGLLKRLTSSNEDVHLKVISVSHSIFKQKGASFVVFHTVSDQLLLPLSLPIGVLVIVVLWVDDDASLRISEVRDDITPSLVIVDTQCDNEVLSGVGQEAEGTGRSATTHCDQLGSVSFVPRATIGIIPDRLLDDSEECILVGLVDLCVDCVAHSERNS